MTAIIRLSQKVIFTSFHANCRLPLGTPPFLVLLRDHGGEQLRIELGPSSTMTSRACAGVSATMAHGHVEDVCCPKSRRVVPQYRGHLHARPVSFSLQAPLTQSASDR